MKANELRLNNYIKLRGNLCQIVSISGLISESVSAVMIDKHRERRHLYGEMQDIEGDELTEEWLLKLGFNRSSYVSGFDNSVMIIYYEKSNLTICNWGDDKLIMSNAFSHGLRIEVVYVHELQNLYFALTGQELTIKN